MKILVYCKDYFPLETGFSLAFRGLCEALVDADDTVHIDIATPAQLADKTEIEKDRVRIFRLRTPFKEGVNGPEYSSGLSFKIAKFVDRASALAANVCNRISYAKQLTAIFDEAEYDVVLFESGDDAIVIASVPDRVLAKACIRFHSTGDTETCRYGMTFMNRIYRILTLTRIAPRVQAILATNHFHLNFIKDFYYRSNPYKCASRYFGVIDNVVPDFGIHRDRGKKNTKLKIVTLGRMDRQGVSQKGFEDLIFALRMLDARVQAAIEVVIVGDGAYRGYLHDLARATGSTCVRFAGRLPNTQVRSELLSAEVILLVSRFEGQSIFAIEGMLAGCAVIFTDTGGLAELVVDNGWKVAVQDINDIANAITKAAEAPPETVSLYGDNSRRISVVRFSPSVVGLEGLLHLDNIARFLQRSRPIKA